MDACVHEQMRGHMDTTDTKQAVARPAKRILQVSLTLPGFHVHQIVGNFLMNGERDGQKGICAEPAVHG